MNGVSIAMEIRQKALAGASKEIKSVNTVSVVICSNAIDRLDWIVETIDSLERQTKKPEEVIVVFECIGNMEDLLHQRLPASVIIVPNSGNRGLSCARNTGVNVASGDIIAFLDDDAIAEPDWLEHMVACLADPVVVGVGGKALPDWCVSGKRPFWFPEEIDWVVGCMHAGFGDGHRIVRNVFGCNMCFRRKQIQEIGGFDTRVGGAIAGDDTDFCIRISDGDAQRQIIYEPKAVIHHKVAPARQTLRYVIYSAWKQGVGKAVIGRIHQNDGRALASEKSYLKLIIFKFIPRQALQLIKHPFGAFSRIITVGIVILSIILGYSLTKIRIVNLTQFERIQKGST